MEVLRDYRRTILYFFLLGSFALAPSASGAACGDIIDVYQGEEDRTPIEDCDNPFDLTTDNTTGSVTYQAQGTKLATGTTTRLLATTTPIDLPVSIRVQPSPDFVTHTLYRHERADYRAVRETTSDSLTVTATGTYTLVTEVLYPPNFGSAENGGWGELWHEWLVPTAHAQIQIAPIIERYAITFTVTYEPPPPPEPTGASSVLFLPGIQASRLYEEVDGEEVLLWETLSNQDIAQIEMTDTGESVNDIYTKDAIPAAFGVLDVYRDFLADLFLMQRREVIEDYETFAYDWRYSVFDVATEPVQYADNKEKVLLDVVLELAENSYTDKVTIIGHSNGGLVAKALLKEYGDNELAGKIDKVVLVGTPQLGTPKAINSMMHGSILDGFADDLFFDNQLVRDTIKNLPGTYTLLPSERYFDEVLDGSVVSNDGSGAAEQVSAYGSVASRSALNDFLLDTSQTFNDTPSVYEPKALNEQLLNRSLEEQNILDNWLAPEGVAVYEVVGTGLPTISGIEYQAYKCTILGFISCGNSLQLQPKLQFTNRGDQTVVAGSAAGYAGDKTVALVDLELEGNQRLVKQRSHSSLTESPAIQEFINSVIRYPYLSDEVTTPEFTAVSNSYTIVSGHSPVTPRIIMSNGDIVGLDDGEVKEEVIGSRFISLASTTYLIVPQDAGDYQIEILGDAEGVYTLQIEELTAEDSQNQLLEIVASTSPEMKATLNVEDNSFGNLQSDLDGDGEIDEVWTPDGERVVDDSPTQYNYEDLHNAIRAIDNRWIERYLGRFATKAEKFSEFSQIHPHLDRLEHIFLRILQRSIDRFERRGRIDDQVAEDIRAAINYLSKK